ncbi:hypothetical protein [Sorangium sp. So ce1182]|uniref:hypothetical protein n=1 Tax=Sorangium sp. So ce1182 TaxID=3133334 RepID=UPI003F603519
MGFGLAATAALFMVFRAGASAWGRSRLGDYLDTTEADWEAERARIRERSRPAGDGAAQADCAASYATLPRLPAGEDLGELARAANAGPRAPLSPAVVAAVERHRPEIDALREAARCSRHELTDDSAWVDHGDVYPVWKAGFLVAIEGHMLAARGDAPGALGRYLTLAKVGADMSAGSSLAGRVGGQAAHRAYLGVAALLASAPRLPAAELAALDQTLAERGRHLPLLSDVLRKERLQLRKAAISLRARGALSERPPLIEQPTDLRALTLVFSTEAVFGRALPLLDARLRRAEQIALDAQRDPSQATRFQEVASDSLVAEASALDIVEYPDGYQHVAGLDCALRASYLLARTAVKAERAYMDGRYPEVLPDLAQDPCGTGPLEYRRSPEGDGYTLSSVGANGKADGPRVAGGRGGDSDDIVVARRGANVL